MCRRLTFPAFPACLAFLALVTPARAEEAIQPAAAHATAGPGKTVYIQAHTSTWRSRGRVSFPVVPSLRMKLVAAGFAIAPDETMPRDLVLHVDYREERGKEIRFGLYGTEITCAVRLEDPQGQMLLGLTIHESPPDEPSVTAPYTDVVHKLETNPYYFFLGEIVKGRVLNESDAAGSLIAAFARLTQSEDPEYGSMKGPPPNPGDSMPPSEVLYVREVRANAARELVRLKDFRAVPVLTRLLAHPDWHVRRLAVESLADMRAADARAEIERLAAEDQERQVRGAAAAALATLQQR